MKKAMTGTMLAVFGFASGMAWADCDFHSKASMASSNQADKAQSTQASAPKASAPVVAKASTTRQIKATRDKRMSQPSKSDASTVVAKSN